MIWIGNPSLTNLVSINLVFQSPDKHIVQTRIYKADDRNRIALRRRDAAVQIGNHDDNLVKIIELGQVNGRIAYNRWCSRTLLS